MKKFRKFLSGVVATATLLMCSFGMTVHADGLLDEVYTNYYYKYILETGEIKPYCLSSDSSLDGYIQTYSNSNSRSGSLMTTDPIIDTLLTPEIISQSYVDLTDKEISSVRSAYSTRSTASNSISEITDYDESIVKITGYYKYEHTPGIVYITTGNGFIIQDWGGKSCIATAGHVISRDFENNAEGEMRKLPFKVEVQVFDRANHPVATYIPDAIHVSQTRMIYNDYENGQKIDHTNPAHHDYGGHDYGLITIPIGGENNYPSLADTYGHLYLGTISEFSTSNIKIRALLNDKMYQSLGNITKYENDMFYTNASVTDGFSGAPIIITVGQDELAVAICGARGDNLSYGPNMKWSVTRFLAFNPCV